MTTKENQCPRVEGLSGQEAEATLDFIAGQAFGAWLQARPEDDEPLSAEDQVALADTDAGRTVSYEEVKQRLGSRAG